MFVIAESGSTKIDWAILREDQSVWQMTTSGINPSLRDPMTTLHLPEELLHHIKSSGDIHYYGAGIISEKTAGMVRDWLMSHGITNKIFTYEDLLASARACCGHEEGIACILGTGSNSCVYDGKKIVRAIPTLGYLLSDEGSGFHLGKKIITAYFYEEMPENVKKSFESKYQITKEQVIESIYKQPEGNKYIASFTKFLSEADISWRKKIVHEVFDSFFQTRVLAYHTDKKLPVNFVGSIAYHFQEELMEVIHKYNLHAKNIIQKPLDALIEFHKTNTNL